MDNTTLRSHLTLLGRRLIQEVRESQCHDYHIFREVLSYDHTKNRFNYVIEDTTGFWLFDRRVSVVGISCSVDDIVAGKQIAVDFYFARFATVKVQQELLDYRERSGIKLEPRWTSIE